MKFLLLPSTLGFSASALISGALLLYTGISKGGGARAVTSSEATQLINNSNAIVVDLRGQEEYSAGTLTGARNIPQAELESRSNDLARFKNRPVILVCASGVSSGKAVAILTAAGFAEVYNLQGGVAGWREAGMPLVRPQTKEQSGTSKKEK